MLSCSCQMHSEDFAEQLNDSIAVWFVALPYIDWMTDEVRVRVTLTGLTLTLILIEWMADEVLPFCW